MASNPLGEHPARMNPLLGIGMKLIGTMLLAVLGAIVKHLSDKFPPGELLFFRSFFGFIPIAIVILMSRESIGLLRTRHPIAHLRRAAFGLAGILTFFLTLRMLPYADATALTFSAPIFLVVLTTFFLGEKVGVYRTGAVIVGFIGMLMISKPHVMADEGQSPQVLAVAVGISSAILIAMSQIAMRFVGRTERALTTSFYFLLAGTVLSALMLPFGWVTPGWGELALLILIGLLSGLVQFCYSQSYRYAEAGLLAPYDYVMLVWALVIGVLIFDEFPKPIVIAGALLIAVSGIFIVLRERYLSRRARTVAVTIES